MSKPLKQIGKGMFSTAYKMSSTKVLIRSIDPCKEAMAHGWFPNTRLFPKVQFNGNNHGEYIMKYLKPVRSPKKDLNPKAYELYLELKDFQKAVHAGFGFIHALKYITNKTVRKHIQDAYQTLRNYEGNVYFEISPRNINATKSGNLILRDCFFLQP